MSWRSSAYGATLVFALLVLSTASGTVWGAFSGTTVSTGNSIVAAADWVAPQVTMLDPGTPLRTGAALNATATDPGGAVSTVTIQISPTGAATWIDVCTDSSSPYNCPLGAVADGSHDLRAVARDTAQNVRFSTAVAARVVDNLAPAVVLDPIASDVRSTIVITATASDQGTGVAWVRFERSLAGENLWTEICTDSAPPYGCTVITGPGSLADDVYDFRAVAQDRAGSVAVSASQTVQVDNAAPTAVAVTAPASPLRGAVTLSATADDDDSGIATVTLQRRSGTGAFIDICTTSATPYGCVLVTTAGATPDGTYDLRAVAVDAAGNTTISAIVTRQIDNSQPSVSVVDPGAFLRGTVVVQANAFAGSGVTQVAIQRAPANGSTFTTICTSVTSPYSCSWATTGVADGLYDLRAEMTYAGGTTLTSAVVADRRVDNSPVAGYDVQAENRTGGTAGRIEAGDVIVLTWSRQMSIATLLAGWSGTGTANLTVRLVDGASSGIGTGGGADALQLLSAAESATGLGSVNLKANYIKAKKTATFAATATQSTVSIAASTARSCASRLAQSPAPRASAAPGRRRAWSGLRAPPPATC